MEITYEAGTVIKRSTGPAEDSRLEWEAELLAAARHAGVVPLLETGDDDGRPWLRLHDAGGVTLESMRNGGAPPGDADLIHLVVVVATTVADLHDIGIVHGAIEPSHVLVDPAGRPLLCSLGRGARLDRARPGDGAGADVQVDVRALGSLLEAVLDPGQRPDLWALASEASGATPAGRRRRSPLSARELADSLTAVARPSRFGAFPAAPMVLRRPNPQRPTSRRRVGVGLAVAALGGVTLMTVPGLLGSGRPGRPGPARAIAATANAAAGAPARPAGAAVNFSGGVLAFAGERYTVGGRGDQVSIGRWWCGAPAVALLRTDGTIYVFDGMATAGVDRPGRLVPRVPGARWLSSRADPATGCDLLVAGGPAGTAVLRPGAPS